MNTALGITGTHESVILYNNRKHTESENVCSKMDYASFLCIYYHHKYSNTGAIVVKIINQDNKYIHILHHACIPYRGSQSTRSKTLHLRGHF